VSAPKPHTTVINASLSGPTGHSTKCRRRQRSQLLRLSLHSQSVHSEANDSLRLVHTLPPQLNLCTLLTATTEFRPTKTESAPNVVRLLSAETECPPKVPICPHSAPKPKPKPKSKFGRPLPFRARATSDHAARGAIARTSSTACTGTY